MSDLIDLNSPDTKGLLSATLASPLIPLPKDTACSNYNIRANDPSALVVAKRQSLENNPFDMLFHETMKYIQKKGDPFEVTLAEAIKLNCKKHTSLRTGSVDLIEDCIRKRKPHKEKLNKTLDESLLVKSLNQSNRSLRTISNDNIAVDLNNSNTSNDVKKLDNAIPFINVQDVDLSILNQSVMNDTLFETDKESNKDQIELNLQNEMLGNIERDKIVMEQIRISTTVLKVPKRRSFSQGETISRKKVQNLNHISLLEPLQIGSDSTNNMLSPNSFDVLNQGFVKSYCSESSVFSSLSNISSIPGQNSYFSVTNSSLMLSNGTMNRSFLENCSSDKSDCTKSSENMDLSKDIKCLLPGTRNSVTSLANVSSTTSTFDLRDRFNKLKAIACDNEVSEDSTNIKNELTRTSLTDAKQCTTIMEENNMCDTNNKLIDIDTFSLESNYNKEDCRISAWDTSSDSVFIEENKVNKSILQEAKHLAKTFEELALKTSSGSASKKMSMTVDTITPPKSHKFISSTPNSTNTKLAFKKTRFSKPVASSTPDAQNAKMQSQIFTCPKKRNFSCDISPVIIYVDVNNNGKAKSPRRNTKLPVPKRMTPKKRQTSESGIPKSQIPPVNKRLNSSFDVNRYERVHKSPQCSLHERSNSQKYSPIVLRINENIQRSPLRGNNKLTHKAKSTSLIPKIRCHSVDSKAMEKENNHI